MNERGRGLLLAHVPLQAVTQRSAVAKKLLLVYWTKSLLNSRYRFPAYTVNHIHNFGCCTSSLEQFTTRTWKL